MIDRLHIAFRGLVIALYALANALHGHTPVVSRLAGILVQRFKPSATRVL